MRHRTALVAVAALAAAGVAAASAVADGGPAPSAQLGWDGALGPRGALRYVALPSGPNTMVAAIRVGDGRVVRWATVAGSYGVPSVAFDGTGAGVSADGRTLVLASFGIRPTAGATTRFAVLRTASLRLRARITLQGLWSFDALSPDARTLYAIEYLSDAPFVRYRVRAVDVATGRPRPGAIVDAREPGERMQGSPVTRTDGPGSVWAYTLYAKPNGTAFVHALDTRHARAMCIELPWKGVEQAIWGVRMAASADGRTLVLRQPGLGRLAVVDLRRFSVSAVRAPVVVG
jgi:hypothetical protein